MILTGDLHASPEELQFLRPGYLKEKYGSQARGPIGATTAGQHHSHSNAGPEPCL